MSKYEPNCVKMDSFENCKKHCRYVHGQAQEYISGGVIYDNNETCCCEYNYSNITIEETYVPFVDYGPLCLNKCKDMSLKDSTLDPLNGSHLPHPYSSGFSNDIMCYCPKVLPPDIAELIAKPDPSQFNQPQEHLHDTYELRSDNQYKLTHQSPYCISDPNVTLRSCNKYCSTVEEGAPNYVISRSILDPVKSACCCLGKTDVHTHPKSDILTVSSFNNMTDDDIVNNLYNTCKKSCSDLSKFDTKIDKIGETYDLDLLLDETRNELRFQCLCPKALPPNVIDIMSKARNEHIRPPTKKSYKPAVMPSLDEYYDQPTRQPITKTSISPMPSSSTSSSSSSSSMPTSTSASSSLSSMPTYKNPHCAKMDHKMCRSFCKEMGRKAPGYYDPNAAGYESGPSCCCSPLKHKPFVLPNATMETVHQECNAKCDEMAKVDSTYKPVNFMGGVLPTTMKLEKGYSCSCPKEIPKLYQDKIGTIGQKYSSEKHVAVQEELILQPINMPLQQEALLLHEHKAAPKWFWRLLIGIGIAILLLIIVALVFLVFGNGSSSSQNGGFNGKLFYINRRIR